MTTFYKSLGLILFLSNFVYGQRTTAELKKDNKLNGEVYIFSIFVETINGSFEDDETEYLLNELDESLGWLQDQAYDFNQDLEFNTDYFHNTINEDVYINDVVIGNSPYTTVRKVMNKIGYDDLEDFFEWNMFDSEEEKFKIVLFVKGRGRSHAYRMARVNNLGLAIIYCDGMYRFSKIRNVISHEILHQFGAWDLYFETGRSQTEKSIEIIREKYFDSIMLSTYRNEESVIDEVTASLIGWSKYKPEFDMFNSGKNKKQIKREARWNRRKSSKIKFKLKNKDKDTNKNN